MVKDTVFVSDSDVPAFKELKTVQIAALLAKRNGGAIDLYKLVKLIYLIDRHGLETSGDLVTFDRPYNMNHGPIMTNTYNLAREKEKGQYWSNYFSYSPQPNFIVKLKKDDVGHGELSDREIRWVNEVFDRFGRMTFSQLRRHTHSLPEYEEVEGTSERISWTELFNATGWEGEDLRLIKEEMSVIRFYDKLVG